MDRHYLINGKIYVQQFGNVKNEWWYQSENKYNDGKLHHVVFTFDGINGIGVVWVDSVKKHEAHFNTINTVANFFCIGSTNGYFSGIGVRPSAYFEGEILRAKVFCRVLTDDEIKAECDSGGVGNTKAISLTIDTNFAGETAHQLNKYEMPSHKHEFAGDFRLANANTDTDNVADMVNDVPIKYDVSSNNNNNNGRIYYTSSVGENLPHNNMPPYYALTYIIKY